jgi:hypothetical protein
MRIHSAVIGIIFLSLGCFSQGIINNGARIVFAGSAQIYIDGTTGHYTNQSAGLITPSSTSSITLLGNWINNPSPVNNAFSADGGGVVLAGTAQNISGSSPTAFTNLSLAGNGIKTLAVNQTTVGGQSSFAGELSVGSSTLDLNSNTINITNSAVGAITRSSGYIISETPSGLNPSMIRWYERTTTGSYVYPFGVAGSYIPFTLSITSAMANAAAYVEVSTRATASSDNQPWASGVTHMYSPNVPYPDGSIPAVIDRWWQVDNSHALTADGTFSYRGSENTLNALYNNGMIGAQYWAGGWLPDNANIGSAAAVSSGVGSVTASGLSTFGPWVLSSLLSPLPIELLSFEGNCSGSDVMLSWCTASESNNDYFSIEQSVDGIDFMAIGRIAGAGTSNQKHCYQYKASSAGNDINYFRLREADKNSRNETSEIIAVTNCDHSSQTMLIASEGGKEMGVIYNAPSDQVLQLYIHNALGQIVEAKTLTIAKGNNNLRVDLSNLSEAVYYVSVFNANEKLATKKIVVSAR